MIQVSGTGGFFPWVCHVCGEVENDWRVPRLCLPIKKDKSTVELVGVCQGECEKKLAEMVSAKEVAEDIDGAFGDRGGASLETLVNDKLDALASTFGVVRKTNHSSPIESLDNETDDELRARLKALLYGA